MKMFVWESVSGLTRNYHDGGGVLVLAEDLERARALLLSTDGVSEGSEVFKDNPNFSASVEECKERVFIFQDAGCC